MKWIDLHCDTLSELVKIETENGQRNNGLHINQMCVDIDRLLKADAAVQFFACFVNAKEYPDWDHAWQAVLSMTDRIKEEISEKFCIMDTYKEAKSEGNIKNNNPGDYITGVLTAEEGGILNNDADRLDQLYERGIRLMTLTWNYENCIGSPNSRDRNIMEKGLTKFGIEVVKRMNEKGMIIDVSHLSDGGFFDCIKYSKYPVIASHSNARSLCRHPRNLSDEMLRALGNNGGIAGLNFYSAFLTESGRASASEIAGHARWMINKAGEDAVALGTDFDGFDRQFLPENIRGVQDMDRVWQAMKDEHITPRQIEKIAFGNADRIMRQIITK